VLQDGSLLKKSPEYVGSEEGEAESEEVPEELVPNEADITLQKRDREEDPEDGGGEGEKRLQQ
jgi:hypothetical protein